MNKMILCTDSKNGIGKNGTIPWHSTEDFKHFKNETKEHKVLMGYKTWLSLPNKPLQDRLNIVVTSRYVDDYSYNKSTNVIFIHESALNDFFRYNDDIIIIGGSTIYEKTLPFAEQIILSRIEGDYNCDTFFDIHANKDYAYIPTDMKVLQDGVCVTYFEQHNSFEAPMITFRGL